MKLKHSVSMVPVQPPTPVWKDSNILAGSTDVEGEGVEIVLDDSNLARSANENPNLYIIHDEDLLCVC